MVVDFFKALLTQKAFGQAGLVGNYDQQVAGGPQAAQGLTYTFEKMEILDCGNVSDKIEIEGAVTI